MSSKVDHIIELIQLNPDYSSKQIHEDLDIKISYATVKRILSNLLAKGTILTTGKRKGTRYRINPTHKILAPMDPGKYFEAEIDERKINPHFNFELIRQVLPNMDLFTKNEEEDLNGLHTWYKKKISKLSTADYEKDLERLAIDLSWKSSQIEGNTYSLLETERLLRDQETAAGKKKDEATMLLNHKEAIDFIVNDPTYIDPLYLPRIEDIHSILMKELGVQRNLRERSIGITGTNFRPIDNSHQIREALEDLCILINRRTSFFDKALLSLILISYIQPFEDGNKRTARMICNGILINNKTCPISFRTVDSLEYKKAMLIFYEQNNISAFKKIFIEQYRFAVENYF